jgi:hypothetical protein
VSKSPWNVIPVSLPSASAPAAIEMRAGWRLVEAAMLSGRVQAVRTGGRYPGGHREDRLEQRVELAAEAAAAGRGTILTPSGAIPSTAATSSRSM